MTSRPTFYILDSYFYLHLEAEILLSSRSWDSLKVLSCICFTAPKRIGHKSKLRSQWEEQLDNLIEFYYILVLLQVTTVHNSFPVRSRVYYSFTIGLLQVYYNSLLQFYCSFTTVSLGMKGCPDVYFSLLQFYYRFTTWLLQFSLKWRVYYRFTTVYYSLLQVYYRFPTVLRRFGQLSDLVTKLSTVEFQPVSTPSTLDPLVKYFPRSLVICRKTLTNSEQSTAVKEIAKTQVCHTS